MLRGVALLSEPITARLLVASAMMTEAIACPATDPGIYAMIAAGQKKKAKVLGVVRHFRLCPTT